MAGVSEGDVVVDGMGRGETNVMDAEFPGTRPLGGKREGATWKRALGRVLWMLRMVSEGGGEGVLWDGRTIRVRDDGLWYGQIARCTGRLFKSLYPILRRRDR